MHLPRQPEAVLYPTMPPPPPIFITITRSRLQMWSCLCSFTRRRYTPPASQHTHAVIKNPVLCGFNQQIHVSEITLVILPVWKKVTLRTQTDKLWLQRQQQRNAAAVNVKGRDDARIFAVFCSRLFCVHCICVNVCRRSMCTNTRGETALESPGIKYRSLTLCKYEGN